MPRCFLLFVLHMAHDTTSKTIAVRIDVLAYFTLAETGPFGSVSVFEGRGLLYSAPRNCRAERRGSYWAHSGYSHASRTRKIGREDLHTVLVPRSSRSRGGEGAQRCTRDHECSVIVGRATCGGLGGVRVCGWGLAPLRVTRVWRARLHGGDRETRKHPRRG